MDSIGIIKKTTDILSVKETVGVLAEYFISDEVSNYDKVISMSKLKSFSSAIDKVAKFSAVKEVMEDVTYSETMDGKQPIKTEYGYEISFGATYTKYEYAQCNHITLDLLSEINLILASDVKLIKKELNLIPQGTSKKILVDTSDLIDKFEMIITAVQDVIAQLDDTNGIIEVVAPLKIQSKGMKLKTLK